MMILALFMSIMQCVASVQSLCLGFLICRMLSRNHQMLLLPLSGTVSQRVANMLLAVNMYFGFFTPICSKSLLASSSFILESADGLVFVGQILLLQCKRLCRSIPLVAHGSTRLTIARPRTNLAGWRSRCWQSCGCRRSLNNRRWLRIVLLLVVCMPVTMAGLVSTTAHLCLGRSGVDHNGLYLWQMRGRVIVHV